MVDRQKLSTAIRRKNDQIRNETLRIIVRLNVGPSPHKALDVTTKKVPQELSAQDCQCADLRTLLSHRKPLVPSVALLSLVRLGDCIQCQPSIALTTQTPFILSPVSVLIGSEQAVESSSQCGYFFHH